MNSFFKSQVLANDRKRLVAILARWLEEHSGNVHDGKVTGSFYNEQNVKNKFLVGAC